MHLLSFDISASYVLKVHSRGGVGGGGSRYQSNLIC